MPVAQTATPLPPAWAVQVRQVQLWAGSGQWLHYRDGRLLLADLLLRHNRPREALEQLLEAWYISLNGPRNALHPREALLATESPPFDPTRAPTPRRLRRQVRRLMQQLALGLDDVQVIFFATTSATYRRYAPPLAPAHAWLVIGAQLLD